MTVWDSLKPFMKRFNISGSVETIRSYVLQFNKHDPSIMEGAVKNLIKNEETMEKRNIFKVIEKYYLQERNYRNLLKQDPNQEKLFLEDRENSNIPEGKLKPAFIQKTVELMLGKKSFLKLTRDGYKEKWFEIYSKVEREWIGPLPLVTNKQIVNNLKSRF